MREKKRSEVEALAWQIHRELTILLNSGAELEGIHFEVAVAGLSEVRTLSSGMFRAFIRRLLFPMPRRRPYVKPWRGRWE